MAIGIDGQKKELTKTQCHLDLDSQQNRIAKYNASPILSLAPEPGLDPHGLTGESDTKSPGRSPGLWGSSFQLLSASTSCRSAHRHPQSQQPRPTLVTIARDARQSLAWPGPSGKSWARLVVLTSHAPHPAQSPPHDPGSFFNPSTSLPGFTSAVHCPAAIRPVIDLLWIILEPPPSPQPSARVPEPPINLTQ
jgi:hypothetical protein